MSVGFYQDMGWVPWFQLNEKRSRSCCGLGFVESDLKIPCIQSSGHAIGQVHVDFLPHIQVVGFQSTEVACAGAHPSSADFNSGRRDFQPGLQTLVEIRPSVRVTDISVDSEFICVAREDLFACRILAGREFIDRD